MLYTIINLTFLILLNLILILKALLPPQLKLLHRQLTESVDNETKLVQDKIRKFTEKQYSGLDEFRTKVENEYNSLSQ